MANQTVTMSREETLKIRAAIMAGKDAILPETDDALSGSIDDGLTDTLIVVRSTNDIVDLASEANGRITNIEKNYTTREEASSIALAKTIIMG